MSFLRKRQLNVENVENPFEENARGVVLLNPVDLSTLSESLRAQPLPTNTRLIVFPLFGGRHWTVGRLFFPSKLKRVGGELRSTELSEIEFLFDDPFGTSKSSKNWKIEMLKNEIQRAFPDSKITVFCKELPQQPNGWDCGPICFENIRDYLVKFQFTSAEIVTNERTFYTIQPGSEFSFSTLMTKKRLEHCSYAEDNDIQVNINEMSDQFHKVSLNLNLMVKELKKGNEKFTVGFELQEKLDKLNDVDYVTLIDLIDGLRQSLSVSDVEEKVENLILLALKILEDEGSALKKTSIPSFYALNQSLESLQPPLISFEQRGLRPNFIDLYESNRFVDKSYFIEDYLKMMPECSIISRPRRFGKTTLLTMVESFFKPDSSDDPLENRREMFSHLVIGKNRGAMEKLGSRIVIRLDMSKTKDIRTYDNFINELKKLLVKAMSPFKDLLVGLDLFDKLLFGHLMEFDSEDALPSSLASICDLINLKKKAKPLILIDEYDCHHSLVEPTEPEKEIQEFITRFYSRSFKSNENYWGAILTGVLPIKDYPTFQGSSWNNAQTFSVVDLHFNSCCGYTEAEVNSLFEKIGLEDSSITEHIKEFYNGYKFGGLTIYNPCSMNNFFETLQCNIYWQNVEQSASQFLESIKSVEISNSLLKLIALKESDEKDQYEKARFHQSFTFGLALTPSQFYTAFTHYGYFTAVTEYDPMEAKFSIPNAEVLFILKSFVKEIIERSVIRNNKTISQRAALDDDFEPLRESIVAYLTSSNDTIFSPNEDLFRLIISFICFHCDENYVFGTEVQSGSGYCDAMFYPSKKGEGECFIIHEYKYESQLRSEAIQFAQQFALWQIFLRDYLCYYFDRRILFPKVDECERIILRGIVGYFDPDKREFGVSFEQIMYPKATMERLRKFFLERLESAKIKGSKNFHELMRALALNHSKIQDYLEDVLANKVLKDFNEEIALSKNKPCPLPAVEDEILSPKDRKLTRKRNFIDSNERNDSDQESEDILSQSDLKDLKFNQVWFFIC